MKYIITIIAFVFVFNAILVAQQAWVPQYFKGTDESLHSVYFLDADTGWIAGFGIILKTTDGGNNWIVQRPIPMNLNSIFFANADTGWAVGDVGAILRTTDGGDSWDVAFDVGGSTLFNHHWSVFFTNPLVGWTAGSIAKDGKVLRTINGGKTWTSQNINVNNWLTSIYFIDENTGWTVGNVGKVFKTQDSGAAWELQYSDSTKLLRSVYFIDENTGWVVGEGGLILKTIDGGANWKLQNSGTVAFLRSIKFIDENNGWAVGDKSVILHTVDGGKNWKLQTSTTDKNLYSVFFVDDKTGWIVGSEGVIMKTTSGGVTSVETRELSDSVIPDQMTLYQNHPNPFNPTTTIQFRLPRSSHVTLTIYDLLGRTVTTLVNGMISAGEHEVKWTAKDLPGGIYFYRLQTGASIQTKKLILQK